MTRPWRLLPRRPALLSRLFLLFYCVTSSSTASAATPSTLPHEIYRGFSATPSPTPPPPLPSSSDVSFQPILVDPSGNFSLGFLLGSPGPNRLDLAVVHLPSALPVWRAFPATYAAWSRSISFSFNGSLILSDASGGILWSTGSSAGGDRVVLLDSSNLQIQKQISGSVVWQSFDSPFDTLVQGQNFTSSAALFSVDRRYSMRLGTNYVALYLNPEAGGSNPPVMYWKETALEERAQIVQGAGPIYARVEPAGFLGMYQSEAARVDVMAFDSFNRRIPGFRRLTLESDGNLRAYYWNTSSWVPDFRAISDACDLPAYCGAYGLCTEGKDECGCLVGNPTGADRCLPADAGDLCGDDKFWELRRTGVELSYKELLDSQKVGTREECEVGCAHNCSCWGALYNNATGSCYRMGFPVETLLATGDDNRVGYFKVRAASSSGEKGKRGPLGGRVAVPVLVVGVLVVLAGVAALGVWEHRRRWGRRGLAGGALLVMGEGLSPAPYKEFKNSASFRAIELSVSSSSSRG